MVYSLSRFPRWDRATRRARALWKKTLFRNGKWEDSVIYVFYRDERAQ